MTERPLYAPGCFGSALFFGADEVCGACEFADKCKDVHQRAKAQLQSFYGIKTPTRAKSDLPVKVRKRGEQLGVSAEEVCESMQQGVSPYRVSETHEGVICQLIISAGRRGDGKIAKRTIEAVLMQRRGLSQPTANVYARNTIHLLSHYGAIAVDGDMISLAPRDCAPKGK